MAKKRTFDFSKSIRDQIFFRQNGRCAHCGINLHDRYCSEHHVIPNQVGEKFKLTPNCDIYNFFKSSDNGVSLCENCESIVHDSGNYQSGPTAPPNYFEFSHGSKKSPRHREWVMKLNIIDKKLYGSGNKVIIRRRNGIETRIEK